MLYGFIGRVSPAEQLKDALDVGMVRTRMIADRVAKASLGGNDGFALPSSTTQGTATAAGAPIDLETEMVGLADEQLRFEATSRLLQKAYQNIHTSIRDR